MMEDGQLLEEKIISNGSSTAIPLEITIPSNNLKLRKEEFVSNTTGTLPIEIFLMAFLTLSCFGLYAVFRIFMKKLQKEHLSLKYAFAFENLLIVVPMLLSFTLLSNNLLVVNLFLNLIIIGFLYQLCWQNSQSFKKRLWNSKASDMKLSYLMNYKANIHITTAICILAVDFDIFPRRFAKAEVFGIGVMDMGVGAIIFSHALTSRQARSQEQVTVSGLISNIKSSTILVILGLLRMFLIKEINYQEHVVEYGEHWNFFFTLAIMKPICNLILLILRCPMKQPLFIFLSVVVIVSYQVGLSVYGMEDIIQNGFLGDKSRSNFLDANREGIFSSIGYMGLYFLGLFFGKQMCKKSQSLYNKSFWLLCWFVAGYISLSLCITFVTPISRQMANLGYYLIQLAFNSLLLLGFLIIDVVCYAAQTALFRKQEKIENLSVVPVSFLSQSISRNLLVYFLLANVMTGLVNLVFDTLLCTIMKSMAILLC